MSVRNLFDPDICIPRPDVLQGTTRDEQFAADLAQVVNQKAPPEYGDPATFFANTFPTRGIRALLKSVCSRLAGNGGEVSPLIRLHTQFGGGKTHGLIALIHAARGKATPVPNIASFIDPALLPQSAVRIAALDGENSDPANGRFLEPGLRAKTLWGELAYQLAGRDGYESVRASDEQHVAPGASTLAELFDGKPALILMDEIAVYLRKVEAFRPGSPGQFTAFFQALLKAVSTSPNVALVFTLALGKDSVAKDAYKDENVLAARVLEEAASIAGRNSTQINPTDEDETADVLRTRLFAFLNPAAPAEYAAAYADVWARNRENLPADANSATLKEQFKKTWPLHPRTVELLTEKTSSLSTFQRTRGMLRLLVRTVHYLWKQKPDHTYAIHPHHIDPAFLPIRDEITVKLGQDSYISALKADVASVEGEQPALAQCLDHEKYPGLPPVTKYVATTIFLHTLAYGDGAKGISAEQLKVDICSPALEPTFIEQARLAFVTESIYLDDRPGANLRFMVEPNLTMMIRKQMTEVASTSVREEIEKRLTDLFRHERGDFQCRLYPRHPVDVPDDLSDDRPLLAVLNWETLSIPPDLRALPNFIAELFETTGERATPRVYRNNVIFVAADERNTVSMTEATRQHLALKELSKAENQVGLEDHQRKTIAQRLTNLDLPMSVFQCYRHLFFPSTNPMTGTSLPLAHTVMELSSVSKFQGQEILKDYLNRERKLIENRDEPDDPKFLRDQTPLRQRGFISTLELRNEYRKSPKLSIVLNEGPIIRAIQKGVDQSVFIFRQGTQVWGKGDGIGQIPISSEALVYTIEQATKDNLWPRAEPLRVSLTITPDTIDQGSAAQLRLTIAGGIGPYKVECSEPTLSSAATTDLNATARVFPTASAIFKADVTDTRGTQQISTAQISVRDNSGEIKTPTLVEPSRAMPPPPPVDLHETGPLSTALKDLFEKARARKFTAISSLTIKLTEIGATGKLHSSAAAVLKGAAVRCEYTAALNAAGLESLEITFVGSPEKASPVKSFLESQIRAAAEADFNAIYSLAFEPALSLDPAATDALTRDLTRFGAGDAYVEARAIQSVRAGA